MACVLVCPRCHSIFATQLERCKLDGGALVEQDHDPLIGEVLEARYVITEALGSGAMGCVYRATHTVLDREYAIKVLFGEMSATESVKKRFRREAKATSRFDHTNIVAVHDFGSSADGLLYIAMEHLPGCTLEVAVLEEAPFEPVRAARIARQVASGLAKAHSMQVVHRDLKPGNIMLVEQDGEEVAKILDFGLARLTDALPTATSQRLTAVGYTLGSPAYIAPEQVVDPTVGPSADLYALGVVLYEMLSGELPFMGSPQQVIRMHATTPPPPLSPKGGLERVVETLLEKRRRDRYPTAEAVIEALDAWLDGAVTPVVAALAEPTPRRLPTETLPTQRIPDLVSKVRAPNTHRAVLGLSLVSLCAVLALAVMRWTSAESRVISSPPGQAAVVAPKAPARLTDAPATVGEGSHPVGTPPVAIPERSPSAMTPDPGAAQAPQAERAAAPPSEPRSEGQRARTSAPQAERVAVPSSEPRPARQRAVPPAAKAPAPRPQAARRSTPSRTAPRRAPTTNPPAVPPKPAAVGYVNVMTTFAGKTRRGVVIVDGRIAGEAPIRIGLPPGKHVVEVRPAGRPVVRRVVDIVSGEAIRVKLEMAPD